MLIIYFLLESPLFQYFRHLIPGVKYSFSEFLNFVTVFMCYCRIPPLAIILLLRITMLLLPNIICYFIIKKNNQKSSLNIIWVCLSMWCSIHSINSHALISIPLGKFGAVTNETIEFIACHSKLSYACGIQGYLWRFSVHTSVSVVRSHAYCAVSSKNGPEAVNLKYNLHLRHIVVLIFHGKE